MFDKIVIEKLQLFLSHFLIIVNAQNSNYVDCNRFFVFADFVFDLATQLLIFHAFCRRWCLCKKWRLKKLSKFLFNLTN